MTGQHNSAIAEAELTRIKVRGKDLCKDLIGKIGFTEYFLLLLTGSAPSPSLIKITDATLVALAEHGLVPSVQAARMTLAAAPDAVQGAVAAGLLGCGSVILGASENAGLLLRQVIASAEVGSHDLDAAALECLRPIRAARQALPGFGHPVHRGGDPRAARLLELADQWSISGQHVAALAAVQRAIKPVWGREFVLNVSGAIPAVLLDAGYPADALRGIPLLARTASLIAHLLEERQRPIGFVLSDAALAAIDYDGGEP